MDQFTSAVSTEHQAAAVQNHVEVRVAAKTSIYSAKTSIYSAKTFIYSAKTFIYSAKTFIYSALHFIYSALHFIFFQRSCASGRPAALCEACSPLSGSGKACLDFADKVVMNVNL
ncbi:hypothetical protein ST47_g9767 [Ascochyta rabiei]|uniref:Uncharacterized protein n=2 Tax=Didymella rabiei TaxID=5454 RepID=A0A162WL85_DIDRA|nr:hypothetical protein ST47_g9767 [Ascochyta rabiei]